MVVLRFYQTPAEEPLIESAIDSRLDVEKLVVASQSALDPPPVGFRGNTDSHPESGVFNVCCPLRLLEMGVCLGGVAWDLGSVCREYFNEDFDGEFPTWSSTRRGGG